MLWVLLGGVGKDAERDLIQKVQEGSSHEETVALQAGTRGPGKP
jgi:hypothetical protein